MFLNPFGFNRFGSPSPSSFNPLVTADSFTASGSGSPAEFDVTGSYAGADTLDLYAVTGTDPITVSQAQLIAGSGGTNTLEFFSVTAFDFATSTFEISGLTATSESATRIAYVIVERNNGGTSGVQTPADVLSGLDFTANGFSSAEVGNVDADTVRVTFSAAQYGSVSHTEFSLTGNTFTASSFTPGNAFVDLTLGTTATSGDDYTGDLTFTGTGLTDAAGNTTPTFSGQTVTNNVSAAGITTLGGTGTGITIVSDGANASTVVTGADITPQAGSGRMFVVAVSWYAAGTIAAPTVELGVQAATLIDAWVGNNDIDVGLYYIKDADLPGVASTPTITFASAPGTVIARAVEYAGVNQTTPFGTPEKSEIVSTAISDTVTVGQADSMVLSIAGSRSNTTPVAVTGSGSPTEIFESATGGVTQTQILAEELPGVTGTVTHTHTGTASDRMSIVMVEMFAV